MNCQGICLIYKPRHSIGKYLEGKELKLGYNGSELGFSHLNGRLNNELQEENLLEEFPSYSFRRWGFGTLSKAGLENSNITFT